MAPLKMSELTKIFEEDGEAKVRSDLESGLFRMNPDGAAEAREWLNRKEYERMRTREDQAARSLIAAERSAAASELSACFAMWSAIISLITVGLAAFGTLIAWLLN